MLDMYGIIEVLTHTQARHIDAACNLLYHNLTRSIGLCVCKRPHSAIDRAFYVSNEGDMPGQRARRPSGNCEKCGIWRRSLHREHIIPRFKGGSDDQDNIQWLCANCHEDKTREDLKGIPGPNKGKKMSEESRRKMSEAAKRVQNRQGHTKGLKFSEERRKAHSEALRRAFRANPRKMPPASEERKRKVSESLKQFYANRELVIEPVKVCNRCRETKDTYADFYWRISPLGRVPCAVCKRCKNAPK